MHTLRIMEQAELQQRWRLRLYDLDDRLLDEAVIEALSVRDVLSVYKRHAGGMPANARRFVIDRLDAVRHEEPGTGSAAN